MLDLEAETSHSTGQPETSRDSLDWDIEVEQETDSEMEFSPAPSISSAEDTQASPSGAEAPAEVVALVAEHPSDTDADFALPAEVEQNSGQGEQPPSRSSTSPRRLSLSQLGIGLGPRMGHAPAPAPAPPPRKPEQPTAEARLQQSFAQSAAKEAQKLGLGITGEVKGALLRATQSVQMSGQGSALFVFTFGENGELKNTTHNTLSGAAADWARVSSLVKATLQKKPAQLPPGTQGAELSYAVDYSFVLPSGSKDGGGLKWSLTQNFDVADIGATKQAIAKVTLKNYQVF